MRCRIQRGGLLESQPRRWNGSTYDLKTIAHGVSGIVLLLPDDRSVIKIPLGSPRSIGDIETEREVYRRLAKDPSPYIVKCLDYSDSRGIILEKLVETIRHRLRRLEALPDEKDVLRWTLQAARGLAVLHLHGIIQADVGCHNMLLDPKGHLKLCDFSGCSIDGKDASIRYETRSQDPIGGQPTKQTDIFALGSAMYEMAVGQAPYHNIQDYDVSRLYEASKFPNNYPVNKNQALWKIIRACWHGDYETVDEVVKDLEYMSLQSNTLCRNLSRSTLISSPIKRLQNSARCHETHQTKRSHTRLDHGKRRNNNGRPYDICRLFRKLRATLP